jgi:hypothetical protein
MKLFSIFFVSISAVFAAVEPKGVSALTMILKGDFHICQLLVVCTHIIPISLLSVSQVRRRLLQQTKPCILIKEETMCPGECSDGPTWLCELHDDDYQALFSPFVTLDGIEDSVLEEDNSVVSGVTTILAEGGNIVNGTLKVPPNATIEYGIAELRGPANNAGQAGGEATTASRGLMPVTIRKVIAVRVRANDYSPGARLAEISDKIFGTDGDAVNLVERYDSCSYGQVLFQPYTGVTTTGESISNGVFEIRINMSVRGRAKGDVKDAAIAVVKDKLGNLADQFDHVMLCLPPNTEDGWIAWGKFYCRQ